MKLLLDQGLPRSAASLLREAEIDTVHTGEIGYATAEDAMIMDACFGPECWQNLIGLM